MSERIDADINTMEVTLENMNGVTVSDGLLQSINPLVNIKIVYITEEERNSLVATNKLKSYIDRDGLRNLIIGDLVYFHVEDGSESDPINRKIFQYINKFQNENEDGMYTFTFKDVTDAVDEYKKSTEEETVERKHTEAEENDDVIKKSWKDLHDSGLLWLINSILHVFGWGICLDVEDNEILGAYPARVKYRGFSEEINSVNYTKISKFMAENAAELLKEAEDE